jgi:hypothetical protein
LNSIPRGPLIGVYCSAYGNSRHWGFWDYPLWRSFLEKVSSVLPENTQFMFIGAEYDVAIADTLHAWMHSVGKQSHLLLGRFHIGGTVELIKQLDYFFVFPSGLGFLADVVNTPHTMWLPMCLELMKGTFVDPENYASQKTYHALFSSPESAFEQFKMVGLRHMEESCQKTNKL